MTLYSILNLLVTIFLLFSMSFIITQMTNGFQFFKKCPYCKRRFTSKTPDYYSCNYYVFSKTHEFSKTNVCYKCYKHNKDVIHLQ